MSVFTSAPAHFARCAMCEPNVINGLYLAPPCIIIPQREHPSVATRASNESSRRFHNHGEAGLRAPTSVFTFKTPW